jgi:di/tricarboxylate transporter
LTPEIATVLAILVMATVLFVTERIRMDVVALLVLVSLALTGLVTPEEALSGFSNMAVVTVWAVLILSGGLARTGLANRIGQQVLRIAGSSEARLIAVIMLTAGVLSGIMNNIGVAALLLPVVVDIAHRTRRPPSKLLMPLAFGALLGGLTTLIGTPPNILVSEVQRRYGLDPFQMFDYTPTGVFVLLAGVAFVTLLGRRLLPSRNIRDLTSGIQADARDFFGLRGRLFAVRVPDDSALVGKSLVESRLGAALGLNVLGIIREGKTQLAPEPGTLLHPDDRLLVEGRQSALTELLGRQHLTIEGERLAVERLLSEEIEVAEVRLEPGSELLGRTLEQTGFRTRFGAIVLAIRRGDEILRTNLEKRAMQPSDVLLVHGTRAHLDALREEPHLVVSSPEEADSYGLEDRLMQVRVPESSPLAGKTLTESRLGDAFGLGVMGIVRGETTHLMPEPDERLTPGDLLLVKGEREDLLTMNGLESLKIEGEAPPDLSELESEFVGLTEVVLSPRTTLAGKTLREIHFREKFGLNVLAIWRGGRPYRSSLRDMALRFGDAMLLYGPRENLKVLGTEPDFLVLTEEAQEAPRLNKAPAALLVMAAVLVPVIFGWLPIAITAVMGVVLMILTGVLTMEEAYRSIEWKAIFLIAGMLPLGIAMEHSGAASLLAEGVVSLVGAYGSLAVMASLFVLAALASQVMPNPAVAVLLAPIAYNTANGLGVSPYPMMMAVAVSASAAFLSPVGHPANVLIMGPGGYRFSDFLKVGIPLTLVVLVVSLVLVPVFWPF